MNKKYINYLFNRPKKEIVVIILSIFLLLYFLYLLFNPISNPSIEYISSSENFNLKGKNLNVKLNANQVEIKSNTTIFNEVKNVEIRQEGDVKPKPNIDNVNRSKIIIKYNYEEDYPTFSKGYFQTTFNNLTIKKDDNFIYFKGDIYNYTSIKIIPNSDKFIIKDNVVKSISINGDEYSDFIQISFDIDETSTVELISDNNIIIRSYNVLNFEIIDDYDKNILSEIILHKSEGLLRVNDRTYNIKNTDALNLKLNSNFHSSISVIDEDIEFNGYATSGQVNGNDILKSPLFYWFDQQTEKINALATLILAFITFINVILTWKYVFLTKENLKQTKESVIQGEASIKQTEANIKQTDKIIKQTKAERIFDNNEKLLMYVYSPMEVILTKFNLALDHIFLDKKSDKIPDEYDQLFKKMNADLLEIKRNYGFLLDNEVLQRHYNVCGLWGLGTILLDWPKFA